jgi:hypothetical protein
MEVCEPDFLDVALLEQVVGARGPLQARAKNEHFHATNLTARCTRSIAQRCARNHTT